MDSLNFLLFVAIAASSMKVSHQDPDEMRLIKDLLINYSPLGRPVYQKHDKVTVKMDFNLRQILDVDEKRQVVTTNVWLTLKWDDHFLKWNASDYGDVDMIRIPYHKLWTPDIVLFNPADEMPHASPQTNIVVSSSGNCLAVIPVMYKSLCYIDMRWFPFDVQRCKLILGSWTYHGYFLEVVKEDVTSEDLTTNGEWDLVEVVGKKNEVIYPCCQEPYFDVTYTMVMRRRTVFYSVKLLLPCIMISMLAVLVFLLPAASGEKISLGITVLLSLAVFMFLAAETVPATSDSVPLLAMYLAVIMVIVSLSVFATVLVLQFHHHDPHGGKMSQWMHVFLLKWCARFLCMKPPGAAMGPSGPQSNNSNLTCVGMQSLESPPFAPGTATSDSGVLGGQLDGRPQEDDSLISKAQSPPADPELAKILEQVRYIAKRFSDQQEVETVSNEWKFAASVIDRLCLVAFTLVTFQCTLGILLSAPNFA